MKITFLLGLFLGLNFIHLYAHRERTYYLYGNINDREVAIQIDEYGDDCMAKYMTLDDKYDHILEGRILKSSQFSMISQHWDSEKNQKVVDDQIYFVEKETDQWTGVWKYKNGEEINFNLKPIQVDSLNHKYINAIKKYKISPYDAYRTKDVKFKFGKKQKISKGSYVQEAVDPATNLSFFRVLDNKKNKIHAEIINDKLIAEHLNMINAKYTCVYAKSKGNYFSEYKVYYLSPYYISYSKTTHQACFSDNVKTATENVTLSLNNGEIPMLEDIFWFGEISQPQLKKGSYEWFQYRYKVFGPKIIEILSEIYPTKMNASESGLCNYNDVKLWQLSDWYFTNKGLYLKYKATNRKVCDEEPWSYIPYEILKPYQVEGSAF